ncbi:MAG: MoxR family ATPase [Desulfobacterales bacterium]
MSDQEGGSRDLRGAAERFRESLAGVVIGRGEAIELIFIALLCEGHVLIEDVPGVGKTLLARAAARALDASFRRIQCTPDLLPSDVTGLHVFNQKTAEFEFRPGPILANVVLVDEINRAMPRTQSCLLEAMQERQVTVDWRTLDLPRPFMLLATQNPIEWEGTFPLPEAQLDRFLLKLRLGYPEAELEAEILGRYQQANPLEGLSPVLGTEELLHLQKAVRSIRIAPPVRGYIVSLVRETRRHPDIRLGASPRAALGLQAAAQARAACHGRSFVLPDDVKALALPALAHRILARTEARLKGRREEELLAGILEELPAPVE